MSIVTVRIEELKEYTKKLGFNVNTICLDYPSKDTIIVGNDILTNVHSCAKTITALAFGFLMQESSISIEDKVISFFPEYKEIASKGTDKIRIKHLMNMSSGKSLKSLLQRCNNDLYENDWLYWFFETPIQFYPGKSFYYSSHCCYVLGRIIEKISKKKVNDYLDEKLWRKLKIQKPIWSDCPKGHTNCAGNLWLKCSDLAKIGNLLLQKGIYKNTQLLHASYIELMINKQLIAMILLSGTIPNVLVDMVFLFGTAHVQIHIGFGVRVLIFVSLIMRKKWFCLLPLTEMRIG